MMKTVTVLAVAAGVAVLGLLSVMHAKNYLFPSVLLLLLAILPFLLSFEKRKPQPREWMPVVVMAAMAAVGRVLFAPIPNVKPTTALIVATAVVYGPQAGFMTGMIAALASNFYFGQGLWTPWQMFGWGMVGLIAGCLKRPFEKKIPLCIGGALLALMYSWFMNIYAALSVPQIDWHGFLALYAASAYLDVLHAVSTGVFLFVVGIPTVRVLRRAKVRFTGKE